MSLPQSIINAALPLKLNVGREYDSAGNHVAYYLSVSPEWRIYRHSVSGMLALMRSMKKQTAAKVTQP